MAVFFPQDLAGDPARPRRAARPRAGAAADRGAGRAARCSSSRCSARSSAASRRRPKRPRSARSARSCSRASSARLGDALGACSSGRARTAQITSMIFVILIGATLFSLVFRGLGGDDMVHRALDRSARRRRRRDPRGDAGDVPARLRDGRLRDHLRGGADRRAGAAQDARRRSGLARRHDGDEPADLLHAPAARADAVLPARRRAAGDHHARTSMSASFRSC